MLDRLVFTLHAQGLSIGLEFLEQWKDSVACQNFLSQKVTMCLYKDLETIMSKLDILPFGYCELIVQSCLTVSKGWDEQIFTSKGTEAVNGLIR